MEQTIRDLVWGLQGSIGRRPARWRGWMCAAITAGSIVALVGMLARSRDSVVRPPDVTSVAILPLTVVSGESGAPFRADGPAHPLVTALGASPGARRTARNSGTRFRSAT